VNVSKCVAYLHKTITPVFRALLSQKFLITTHKINLLSNHQLQIKPNKIPTVPLKRFPTAISALTQDPLAVPILKAKVTQVILVSV